MRIEQVDLMQVFANQPRISRNRKNRAAGYSAFGRTDGGRAIRVNFRYDPASRAARPISAWEDQ
ncbi:MAG: hypothetical protein DLM60_12435 [Pseudonocardiales bacterium]|nr:MAG: hypothetical protein DLM60_12435 [Pseudonocardiales bacterium]